MTEERKNEIIEKLEKLPARSAWRRGVKVYAVNMLEELLDRGADLDALTRKELEKAALNGADTWGQYSYGGCSLIYSCDIAELLCSPSELKKMRGGERQPRPNETWLDVQARALYQAFLMVDYARQTAGPRG